MTTIEKDIAIAALVRAFFKYYVTGILEKQSGTDVMERFEPRNIKMTMLNHYGNISRHFNSEAFYAVARMNYEQEEIERELRRKLTAATSDMELVRLACRTDDFYQTLVSEYKRNFTNLLNGHIETQDEHLKAYTRCPSIGKMDTDMAESIVNRMAARAYEIGSSLTDD